MQRAGSCTACRWRVVLDPIDYVAGAEQLVEIFGAWPSFHDSEILELRLKRRGRDEFEGPQLEIVFHLFQGERDPAATSGVRWFNHTQATFRFSNVCELAITEFNNQNAILDLLLEAGGAHPMSTSLPAVRVTLQPGYGVGGSFLCSSIEVVKVEAGCPPGSVYS